MVAAVAAGVTITVSLQIVMSSIELLLLILFAFSRFFMVTTCTHSRGTGSRRQSFTARMGFRGSSHRRVLLLGLGRHRQLNEETKGAKKTPGMGGIIGIIGVFVLFEVFTIATNMVVSSNQIITTPRTSQCAGSGRVARDWRQIHRARGRTFHGRDFGNHPHSSHANPVCHGARPDLPKKLGTVHPNLKTPIVATAAVTVFSLALFIGSQFIGSVGFNSHRRDQRHWTADLHLLQSRRLRRSGALPPATHEVSDEFHLHGSVAVARSSLHGGHVRQDHSRINGVTLTVGLGAMALGLIPMTYYWMKGNPYFDLPTKEDRLAVIEEFEMNL